MNNNDSIVRVAQIVGTAVITVTCVKVIASLAKK